MPALFVILVFATPIGAVLRYVPEPVPAPLCMVMAQQLALMWHAADQTCMPKPPVEAMPLLPGGELA